MTEPVPTTVDDTGPKKRGGIVSALRLESIKSRIIVLALLATSIPYAGMAWFTYAQNRSAITIAVSEELRTFSSQAAREADLWLKQRVYDLGVFATSSAVIENVRIATELDHEASEEARGLVRDYLESVEQRVRGYDGLRIVDTEALVVAATGTTEGLTLDPDLPEGWLDAFREDRPALGEPRRGSNLPGDGISVGVPIRSSGGDLLGGLFATLNLQPMGTVLAVYSPGENGSVYVVTTASERILGGQMTTESMGTVAREQVVGELIALGGSSLTYVGDSGEEVTGAARPVGDLGWAVVAEVPAREPYERIVRLRNTTLFGVSVMLLVVGLVAYRVGHLIVRPLDRLTEGATEVAGGDLAVDLPVGGGGEVGILTEVFNEMVARLRSSREQLEELLVTDALTGLFNRRHLMVLLADEMHRCHRDERPFTILMIDVDRFKEFNDTHGHMAGDEALTVVASVLKASTRQVDRIARYGGEEFVALLPTTDLEGAVRAAERIRANLAKKTIRVGGVKATVTVSTGVAELPSHGEDPNALMAAADAALYQAKRAGRDRIVVAGMPETANARKEAEPVGKASQQKKASPRKKASSRKKVGTASKK